MRKLKLQVQMTVDGYIAGPNSEMDWVTFNWDDALKNYVTALTEPVDCLVLGRKLAEGFIPTGQVSPPIRMTPNTALGLNLPIRPEWSLPKRWTSRRGPIPS